MLKNEAMLIQSMQHRDFQAILSVASIYALRMLGIFMVLPVFTLYAQNLEHVTPMLIGVAAGVYGLTQALFQIPFGTLSDYCGRKSIILLGLAMLIIGSIMTACATSITTVIIGRALQGAGAIGSTLLALLSDMTQEENRTKAMAIIGLVIGITFALALAIGPALNIWLDVSGLFWLTALFAFISILILLFLVPKTSLPILHEQRPRFLTVCNNLMRDRNLLQLNWGILALHIILSANFVILPIVLHNTLHIAAAQQCYIYLFTLLGSFILMLPFIYLVEKAHLAKPLFLGAIVLLGLSQLSLLLQTQSILSLSLSLLLFFVAFNFLEANLPSMISKQAPIHSKGTAMGIYSSAQFLGIFLGGVLAGWLYGINLSYVFIACIIIAVVWLVISLRVQLPTHLKTQILKLGVISAAQIPAVKQQLMQVRGVKEAWINPNEGIALLKVDRSVLNEEELTKLSESKF